ncbi:hypothetical protein FA95DRAFT_1567033 [Auriscalpium vulgare]|uniref:Uncharacterized protein n=1 Tax=Auriscalpium vulgare TaxID=40419 RepID=A0ACB8R713_9AGAM|nr:hypothetical protein FA95DRAFT_1567033 [Auriscalpium vulgare]
MCLFRLGTPLRETLPLMERIRGVTRGIVEIWEHSELMQTSLLDSLKQLWAFENEARVGIKYGRPGYVLDRCVQPTWLQNEKDP